MFGIIDENKKFLLLDADRDTLRATALLLAKEIEIVVPDYDEDGKQIGEHTETKWEPIFTEETVDEAISEYTDKQIETAYNGEKYVSGYAPAIDNEYQSAQREKAYESEIDPITAHIQRLRDKEQTPEIVAEIEALRIERDEKIAAIKERYPYTEG